MGERWSIAWLRELATTPCACSPQPRAYDIALVEAVEAAQRLRTTGYSSILYARELTAILARFDFDAPSPTEGETA